MKNTSVSLSLVLFMFVFSNLVFAGGEPWKSHQSPNDFLFGNHIDTHQQAKEDAKGSLSGDLYIEYTGKFSVDGFPIAKHTDCEGEGADCSVGWTWRAVPGSAQFVYHEDGDHPVWQVTRSEIPQPGSYSHFHWTGTPEKAKDLVLGQVYEGYFIELNAKDKFVFEHGSDSVFVTPGIDLSTHLNIVTVFPEKD